MPFAGVGREVARLRAELDAAVSGVLDHGHFVLGEQVERFEEEWAAATGSRHAVGVGSGTDAIEVALRALGVGAGDEVVTQANTCIPTVAAIERAGATPVLCDVEPDAGTIDPGSLLAAVGPRTAAVVAVHLYGQCGDLEAVEAVAAARGIALIEDCAQAHGAEYDGRPIGTVGAVACFSFYPTKNVGALGDAGAVVTGDASLAERVRRLRTYGQGEDGESIDAGVNSRLDELQAALLRVKLRGLGAALARRAEIASRYDQALAGTPVRPLPALPGRRHARHLYVVEADNRDAFRTALAEHGVGTLVHYARPVHGHAAYSHLGGGAVTLANAERLAARVLSLPLHPDLSDEEVSAVAGAARRLAVDREGT